MKRIKAKHGETRILKKFTLLPIRIEVSDEHWRWREWRWLEWVKVKQTWYTNHFKIIGKYAITYSIIRSIKVRFFGGYWESEFIDFDLSDKRDMKLKKLGI